jgi:hypothetical protein
MDVPDKYLDHALRTLGEQLNATKKIWDMNAKCLIDIPDEKIRQYAALAILASKWDKPVERSTSANMDTKDFPKIDQLTSQSLVFQAIEAEVSQRNTIEAIQATQTSAEPS